MEITLAALMMLFVCFQTMMYPIDMWGSTKENPCSHIKYAALYLVTVPLMLYLISIVPPEIGS
jgi:hypothetical protein